MATRVEYIFDPFELVGASADTLTERDKSAALKEVASYVRESVLEYVSELKSPVSGQGSFKPLSKKYKEKKLAQGGSGNPDLVLDGDLLDSLVIRKGGGTALSLTVASSQMGKADGHNNHSGDSRIPRRAFIPDGAEGETFKKQILQGIKEIIEEYGNDGN